MMSIVEKFQWDTSVANIANDLLGADGTLLMEICLRVVT